MRAVTQWLFRECERLSDIAFLTSDCWTVPKNRPWRPYAGRAGSYDRRHTQDKALESCTGHRP